MCPSQLPIDSTDTDLAIDPLVATYNHLEVGHPDNPKPYRICGYMDSARQYPCRNRAGRETDHLGMGRCYVHGGRAPAGERHWNWKGGITDGSPYIKRLRARLAQLRQDKAGKDPLDLVDELEVSRFLLALAVEQLEAHAVLQPGPSNIHIKQIDSGDHTEGVTGGGDTAIVNKDTSAHIDQPQFLMVKPEYLDIVRHHLDTVSNLASKIVASRNATAYTQAEVLLIVSTLKEGIERFVPKENRIPFLKWIKKRMPIGGDEEEEAGEVEQS